MKKINIEQANRRFSKLPKWKQRVAIARDMMEQVLVGQYLSSPRTYFQRHNWDGNFNQETLLLNKNRCQVCARGALTLSTIRKDNKFDSISMTTPDMEEIERRFFTEKQTALMEQAFEGWWDKEEQPRKPKAVKFYSLYPDKTARLIAICRNIIKNRGTFKP